MTLCNWSLSLLISLRIKPNLWWYFISSRGFSKIHCKLKFTVVVEGAINKIFLYIFLLLDFFLKKKLYSSSSFIFRSFILLVGGVVGRYMSSTAFLSTRPHQLLSFLYLAFTFLFDPNREMGASCSMFSL